MKTPPPLERIDDAELFDTVQDIIVKSPYEIDTPAPNAIRVAWLLDIVQDVIVTDELPMPTPTP